MTVRGGKAEPLSLVLWQEAGSQMRGLEWDTPCPGTGGVVEPPHIQETCVCQGPDTQPWSQPLVGTQKDVAFLVRCKSSPDGSGLPAAPPATPFSTHEDLM